MSSLVSIFTQVVTTGDGRQSDPFTTHDAGPMLADIDLIVDISSAYFVWRECPDRLLSCPVVTLCRYLTGLTFVHKTPRYVLIFLLTHCEYSMR